jgi:hypothetical protein
MHIPLHTAMAVWIIGANMCDPHGEVSAASERLSSTTPAGIMKRRKLDFTFRNATAGSILVE